MPQYKVNRMDILGNVDKPTCALSVFLKLHRMSQMVFLWNLRECFWNAMFLKRRIFVWELLCTHSKSGLRLWACKCKFGEEWEMVMDCEDFYFIKTSLQFNFIQSFFTIIIFLYNLEVLKSETAFLFLCHV